MSSHFKPPDRKSLESEYTAKTTAYSRLVEEICFTLKQNTNTQRIELHGDIQFRVKDFESFYSKIIRYEFRSGYFDAVEDIAGVRIVCLYRSDLERIGKLISENFRIIEADIKTQRIPSSEFGYMADHYIVKLSEECRGPRYDELKSLKCEIQVRTILMDAWDSISHHLDYKQEIDIPTGLRRDFYALSGLFFVADTHFEMFRDSVSTLKRQLRESVRKDQFDLNQEMNLDTLQAYLRWKLPERKKDEEPYYSELLSELQATGYGQFSKLDSALEKMYQALISDEKEDPPFEIKGNQSVETKYTDVGVIRYGLSLLDPIFTKYDLRNIIDAQALNHKLNEKRAKHKLS